MPTLATGKSCGSFSRYHGHLCCAGSVVLWRSCVIVRLTRSTGSTKVNEQVDLITWSLQALHSIYTLSPLTPPSLSRYYDFVNDRMYTQSDKGNLFVVHSTDFTKCFGSFADCAETGGRKMGFEGLAFGGGKFVMVDDRKGNTDDGSNGLWVRIAFQ